MGAERRIQVRRQLAHASVWLCLGLLVSTCAILQAQEFQRAVGHLSQAEVVVRWGLPESVVGGIEGQTLWIYTVRVHARAQPGGILVTSPG
jgi:hypothetical protein